MKLSVAVKINSPAQSVFKYFINPKNLKNWVFDLSGYKLKKGNSRKEGASGVMTFGKGESRLEVTEVVREIIPNKKFESFQFHNNMESTNVYSFSEPEPGTTDISLSLDIRMKPFFMNWIAPLLKSTIRKQQLRDLRKLKQVIENEDG